MMQKDRLASLAGIAFFALTILSTQIARAENDSDLAQLNQKVVKLYQKGDFNQATEVVKKSLALAEALHGPNDIRIVISLSNLAELYRIQGQYAQAEPLYKRSLAIREKALGPNHPEVAA